MSAPVTLIVEPYASGHRAVWAEWIASALAVRGRRVVVATLADSLEAPAFAWLRAAAPPITAVTIPVGAAPREAAGPLSLLAGELRLHRMLAALYRGAARRFTLDAVVLPFGDYALHACAVLGSPFGGTRWITVVMRPSFHYRDAGVKAPLPRFAALRRAAFRRFVRLPTLRRCLTIDEPLFDALGADRALGGKLGFLADPVAPTGQADRAASRRRLGLPDGALVVLVFGTLTARKGVAELLAGIAAAGRPELCVLAVGAPDADTRALLAGPLAAALRATGRLQVVDGWVDAATAAAAFAAADVAWLGYRDHWQSSGVLVQAGVAGLPVIGCDAGLIGWQLARHGCGLGIDVTVPERVAGALEALAASPTLRATLGRRGAAGFAGYTVAHASRVIAAALDDGASRATSTGRPVAGAPLGERR
jgi:glycosyltransferase involved in cell wall biosynthesis